MENQQKIEAPTEDDVDAIVRAIVWRVHKRIYLSSSGYSTAKRWSENPPILYKSWASLSVAHLFMKIRAATGGMVEDE